MIPKFNFVGFTPVDEIKKKASLALERLLDVAPYGAVIVALLQKDELSYACGIEIYSKHGPFIARASNDSADVALESVTNSLLKKLDRWKKLRRLSPDSSGSVSESSVA